MGFAADMLAIGGSAAPKIRGGLGRGRRLSGRLRRYRRGEISRRFSVRSWLFTRRRIFRLKLRPRYLGSAASTATVSGESSEYLYIKGRPRKIPVRDKSPLPMVPNLRDRREKLFTPKVVLRPVGLNNGVSSRAPIPFRFFTGPLVYGF